MLSRPCTLFDPRRTPVFYGWILVVLGALTILASSPGQTAGISAFVDDLLALTGLDRAELSAAYLLGTLASGCAMPIAGRWVDRYGARRMLMAACILMALTLVLLARIDVAAWMWVERLNLSPMAAYLLLLAGGFACLRFAGQGLMVICCSTTIGHWFHRRRGVATAIKGTVLSLAGNATPLFFLHLIAAVGWRDAWLWCAAVVGIGWSLVVAASWRDTPESCGLAPDGDPVASAEAVTTRATMGWAVQDAVRTGAFWTVAGNLALLGMVLTSVTFHLSDIGRAAGLDRSVAHAFLLVVGVSSLPIAWAAGWLADRLGARRLCLVMATCLLVHVVSMAWFGTGIRYLLPGIALGIAAGISGPLAISAYPRFFGRRYLGGINGASWSLVVVASAVGPVAYAMAREHTGSYTLAMIGLVPVILGLLAAAWCLRPPATRTPLA